MPEVAPGAQPQELEDVVLGAVEELKRELPALDLLGNWFGLQATLTRASSEERQRTYEFARQVDLPFRSFGDEGLVQG